MHPVEIAEQLRNIKLIADTREQNTDIFRRRISAIGWEVERQALVSGDYSCRCPALDLSDKVAVERKMSLDELAQCFGKDRKRFVREFERAKERGIRIWLLVENATWEKIFGHKYRSRMTPQALAASLIAFETRYDCRVVFCREESTAYVIREILFREMKERLGEV